MTSFRKSIVVSSSLTILSVVLASSACDQLQPSYCKIALDQYCMRPSTHTPDTSTPAAPEASAAVTKTITKVGSVTTSATPTASPPRSGSSDASRIYASTAPSVNATFESYDLHRP